MDWEAEFGCDSHLAIDFSAGQVVDGEGRAAIGIENRRLVLKRWLRKRRWW